MSLSPPTGTAQWYRADSLALANGAAVASWGDVSGNNRTVSQATTANRPSFVANAVNGRPGVRFTAANSDYLEATTGLTGLLSGVGGYTAIVVYSQATRSAETQVFHFASTAVGSTNTRARSSLDTSGFPIISGRRLDADTGATVGASAGAAALGTYAVSTQNIDYANAQVAAWLNGTQVLGPSAFLTAGNTSSTTPLGTRLGAASATSNLFDGTLCEILVYPRTLTATERAVVHTYLADKYNLTVTDYLSNITGSQGGTATSNATATVTVPARAAAAASARGTALANWAPPLPAAATAGGTSFAAADAAPPPPPAILPAGWRFPARQVGYLIVIRDAANNQVGALHPTSLLLTPRYNDVGEWTLTVPLARSHAERLRAPGAGVLIYRGPTIGNDPPIMSGPVGERSVNRTEQGLILTVSGPDDNVWVAGRLALQNPARTGANQNIPLTGAVVSDRRTGPAETVIKGYVNGNAGPGAIPERRRLTVEPDGARGALVSDSVRMTPLLDRIQALAETGGIGFKVVQVGTDLEFQCYQPVDRSSTARFGTSLGNLTDFVFTEKAPSESYAVVGGQGTGTERVFLDAIDTEALAAWPGWRMERFHDRRDTELTEELQQALDEGLLQGGPSTTLSMSTKDTERLRFGRDYRVGDIVTVEPMPGVVVTDVLREVAIAWEVDGGESVISHVGSYESSGTPGMQRRVRQLQVRINAVETVE